MRAVLSLALSAPSNKFVSGEISRSRASLAGYCFLHPLHFCLAARSDQDIVHKLQQVDCLTLCTGKADRGRLQIAMKTRAIRTNLSVSRVCHAIAQTIQCFLQVTADVWSTLGAHDTLRAAQCRPSPLTLNLGKLQHILMSSAGT